MTAVRVNPGALASGRMALPTNGGSWISQKGGDNASIKITTPVPTGGNRYDTFMGGTFEDGSAWAFGGIMKKLYMTYYNANQTANSVNGEIRFDVANSNVEASRFNGKSLLDWAYPVGAIYMSVSATSPATLFGGTWERITGRFLLAATDGGAAGGNSNASIAAGNTGGEASHKLTSGESGTTAHGHGNTLAFATPSLSHTVSGGVTSSGSHTIGGGNHYHSLKFSSTGGSGSARAVIDSSGSSHSGNVTYNDGSHSHTVSNHTHTHNISVAAHAAASCTKSGAVSNATAADASSAHNNMPPYLAVYVWKRTA